GKGSTWEGGMREPGIFWWPGTIQPKVVRDLGCSMDLFTTCIKLCGAKLPDDRPIDGLDLSPVLLKGEPSPRDTMFYYRGDLLCAVRHGPYKMYLRTQNEHNYGDRRGTPHDPPWLFHVEHDPSERFHLEKKHPEVIKKLSAIIAEHRKNLVPAKTQMEAQIPKPKKKAP
ncbi:MAG: sulfatase-like hydrolase/transferase, partial [Sedimentisphaerales bacterium]|nr:sulfatase-like hydrolase/transferase [Sedimentisphaerales bacterium]